MNPQMLFFSKLIHLYKNILNKFNLRVEIHSVPVSPLNTLKVGKLQAHDQMDIWRDHTINQSKTAKDYTTQ